MISGNEMMNNQLAAIMAFGTTNNSSIINNYIHNNGTRGIEMRSSNNTMISGNTLRDNLVANILINATAVNATVRNNLIESTAVFTGNAHGVYTYGS
jgi:parallel beta-helix repeat protein